MKKQMTPAEKRSKIEEANAKRVVDMLIKAGWKQEGVVKSFKLIEGRFGSKPNIIDFTPRKRFKHNKPGYCTVGKRTTCFYLWPPHDFHKYKTSDFQAIKNKIKEKRQNYEM